MQVKYSFWVLLFSMALSLGACKNKNLNPTFNLVFAGTVNGEPLECGRIYEEIGQSKSSIEVRDVRFYVHDIEFIQADGSVTPLTLKKDDEFQLSYTKPDGTEGGLALVDFTNTDSEMCSLRGTKTIHTTVSGRAPQAEYTAVRFKVGVPQELNHVDGSVSAPPLNAYGMQWTWTSGYRHMKIDVKATTNDKTKEAYYFHPGAQGCESTTGTVKGPYKCTMNFAPEFELELNPETQAVELDLARFYAQDDLNRGRGCMFVRNIPDMQDGPNPGAAAGLANGCDEMFAAVGLALPDETMEPNAAMSTVTQTAFRTIDWSEDVGPDVSRARVSELDPKDPYGWPHPDYPRDSSLDISARSSTNGTKSHKPGDLRYGSNCMQCHQQSGPGFGKFVVAGTIYSEDGSPWTDGGYVEIGTADEGFARRPDLSLAEKLENWDMKFTLSVDANGQFYSTTIPEINYQEQTYFARILDQDKTLKMVMPIAPSGSCNHCHSTGFQIRMPAGNE